MKLKRINSIIFSLFSNPKSTHPCLFRRLSAAIATPAFRSFISCLTSTVRQGLSQRRPWLEFIDGRSSFTRPDSLTDAASRIRKNFSYFRINCISLLDVSLALSLLTHPFSLLVLGILLVSTVVVVFFISVGSVLISALLVGLAVVCVHRAFRMPEDLFLDDQEPANTGFLSFLGGAALQAAAAATTPVVAMRV